MAEPLKNFFGPEIPKTIGDLVSKVHPQFPRSAFVREALKGYEALELMDRGRKIAAALRNHLPQDYPEAIRVLVKSTRQRIQLPGHAMASFLFLPHQQFIELYGLGNLEESLCAIHELTGKFSAEFSIRPFLIHHREETLKRLRTWTNDPDLHVRRLVSEGTRPRLPWAPRLPDFQKDPQPVLELLEHLKDDPELTVRRSVANNLNDIGKDHPTLLVATAGAWMQNAPPDRRWLIRHALRFAVKRGEPGALRVLGFGTTPATAIHGASIHPKKIPPGGRVEISCSLKSKKTSPQKLLVDFRVHFVKANGTTAPKVFKWKQLVLQPGEAVRFQKKLSCKDLTTRRHHPGIHRVELLVNGEPSNIGSFEIEGSKR